MALEIERVLAVTSAGPLLGGLGWRPVVDGRPSMRRLHEARHLVPDASHYTLFESAAHCVYGLYQARASEEHCKLPRGIVSAAHCFASLVGQSSPNGALILTRGFLRQRSDEKVYVVVLDEGIPVVDSLTSEMEARNALGSEERHIWSDDPGGYPNATEIDFEWLGRGASRAARVLPIPVNPWPLALVAGGLAVMVLAWGVVQQRKQAEAQRQLAAARAASDPVPKYLSALSHQTPRMAVDRESFVRVVEQMFMSPVHVPGWNLKSAECSARSQLCASQWLRRGGSYTDLREARPGETLEIVSAGAGVPLLDLARTSSNFSIERRSLVDPARPLLRLHEALATAGPLFQLWKTADMAIDIKPPALWPQVESVPPGFTHPAAIQSGQITVSEVPGPFIAEALRTAPSWISWESVQVDIGEGDVKGRLKFKATGSYYARRD